MASGIVNDEIDAVYVIYNEFKSVVSQTLTVSKVLPVTPPKKSSTSTTSMSSRRSELFAALLPKYIELQVFTAMIETSAAEHAARMTAMDAATSNASDMIDRADDLHEPRAPGQHHSRNYRGCQRRFGA